MHRQGQVAYLNPAAVRALGVPSADERVGTPVADMFHDEDRAVVESRVLAPAANTTHETFGLRWLGKGGSYRTTEAAAAPIDFDGSAAVVTRAISASGAHLLAQASCSPPNAASSNP